MVDYRLILPLFVAFFITLFILPLWIKKAKQIGLLWEDMNKTTKEKVAGSGGVVVVGAFIFAILVYIAYITFILRTSDAHLIEIFALLTVVLLLISFGIIDDLFGWHRGGLSKKSRLIMVLFAAIPLMVINAGNRIISLPFVGPTDLGIIYPLILIPFGVLGAATTYNFLAGFNGLEAGQGILILSALALVAKFTGDSWLSIISLCMVVALLAFLVFNFSPAKVFPGNSLTYTIGGLIAIMAILGNFEKIALFFFIPYIIETILKSRGKLAKHSFGLPKSDGTLDLNYDKIYGLTHLSIWFLKKINIKPTEKRVVYTIWVFQFIIIIIGFIIFREGIFMGTL